MLPLSSKNNKQIKIETASNWFNIPTPKPGQILVSPMHERLFDPESMPIDNSVAFPEWYKSLDKNTRSFRHCEGAQDYLKNGVTFRLPAPVEFRPSPSGDTWEARWGAGDNNGHLHIHGFAFESTGAVPISQTRALQHSNYVKIINPWIIRTAPGWSSMVLPVFWERTTRDWEIVPGVVNTDYYHTAHWVINIYTDKPFVIPYGTPIAHMATFPRTADASMILGDEKIASLLTDRGFGGPFVPFNRRSRYRAEQRKNGFGECPVGGLEKTRRVKWWNFWKRH